MNAHKAFREIRKALQQAAIKRSIPKQPILFARENDGDTHKCPSCNSIDCFDEFNFCPYCGQMFRWHE